MPSSTPAAHFSIVSKRFRNSSAFSRMMPLREITFCTRGNTMSVVQEIGSLIVSSNDVRGGRPRIAGTGVTVQRIVRWYRLVW